MKPRALLIALTLICLPSPPAKAQEMQSYLGTQERKLITFRHYAGPRASYCSIEYGAPLWQAGHDELLPKLRGTRIRFGMDSWAHLELSTPAGKQMSPGYYCLALDYDKDGQWYLAIMDAAELRMAALTPCSTARVVGIGGRYVLQMQRAEEELARFVVSFKADPEEVSTAQLRVQFGSHLLTAPLTIDLSRAPLIKFPKAGKGG